jgi:hypothetical protein
MLRSMDEKRIVAVTVTLVAAMFIVGGCASGGIDPNGCDWTDSPGAVTEYMAAVGAAPILNERSEPNSRTFAEADGRAKLAASLRTKINQLVENWAKDTGDLTQNASFASYVNNELLTRQFVDTEVGGAFAHKYCRQGNVMYVLLVLRDPAKWVQNLANTVRDTALQDEALWKTEVMKNDFRDRMDKLRDGQVQKYLKQNEAFQGPQSGAAAGPI